jgi:Protein of unknown function (DUF1360)
MTDTDARIERLVDRVDPGPAPSSHGAAHTHGRGVLARVARWYLSMRREYQDGGGQSDERPLTGYALLSTGYLVAAVTAAVLVARRRRGSAALPTPGELALLSVAVFRTTRTMSKDAVLSHLRAPFTVFEGPAGPGEVMESPRPGAVRHAVGELLTCPFCLGQWVATAALVSFAAAPRATRWVATLMTVVAAGDALQYAYAALEKTEH